MPEGDAGWSLMDEPFAYAIFPLVCLVIAIFIASLLYTRRRRLRMSALRNNQWPQDHGPPMMDDSIEPRRSRRVGSRWAPWSGTRTAEGLNELGEAPPPYDGKREGDNRADEVELRDLEMNRPPQYPAEPGLALVRDRRFV